MSTPRRARRMVALTALAGLPAALLAHDFWIVPMVFEVNPGRTVEVLGQTGVRFPVSTSAVAPERVMEARLISRDQDEKLTDLSIREKSLLLRHRPEQAGQRIVAVTLAPASRKVTVANLKRYIGLEGAPELAQRYEQEGKYPQADSVTQRSQKFAKAIMEVGHHGPRAFSRPAGHLLEIIPQTDPFTARPGQSFDVKVLYRGNPLPHSHLRAGMAADSAAASNGTAAADTTVVTDAQGIARLPVRAGLWNVRLLHAAPAPDTPGDWEVFFATLVFNIGTSH